MGISLVFAPTASWATTAPVCWHSPASRCIRFPAASRAPRNVLPSKAITRRPLIVLVRNHIHAPISSFQLVAPGVAGSGGSSTPTAPQRRHRAGPVPPAQRRRPIRRSRRTIALRPAWRPAPPRAPWSGDAARPAAYADRAPVAASATGPPGRQERRPTRRPVGRSRRQRSGWAMMTRRARQRFPECDWCEDCDHHRCCRARPATTPVPRVTPAKLQVATSHHDFAEALGPRRRGHTHSGHAVTAGDSTVEAQGPEPPLQREQ